MIKDLKALKCLIFRKLFTDLQKNIKWSLSIFDVLKGHIRDAIIEIIYTRKVKNRGSKNHM